MILFHIIVIVVVVVVSTNFVYLIPLTSYLITFCVSH